MIRKISGLPFISFKEMDDETGCSLRPHSHPELSVGLVITDGTRVTVEGLDFSMTVGDLILIPADQVHLCRPQDSSTFRFLMIFFDAWWVEETIGLKANHIRPVSIPCPAGWRTVFDSLSAGREEELTENDRLAGLLSALAVEGDKISRSEAAMKGADRLETVRQRVTGSPEMDLRVDEMASMAGMSKFDFLRKYTRRYGQTPHASVTDRRIRLSLEMMAAGKDLTGIAMECGFSDQSHFTRQFRLYTGMKPSEYRRAITA